MNPRTSFLLICISVRNFYFSTITSQGSQCSHRFKLLTRKKRVKWLIIFGTNPQPKHDQRKHCDTRALENQTTVKLLRKHSPTRHSGPLSYLNLNFYRFLTKNFIHIGKLQIQRFLSNTENSPISIFGSLCLVKLPSLHLKNSFLNQSLQLQHKF